MRKPLLVILLFAVVSVIELFSSHEWVGHQVVTYDASGYYLYLPATLIYKDAAQLRFYPEVSRKYRLSDQEWYGLYRQEATGRWLNKYPAGVAFGELPLFLVAHAVCRVTGRYPADGYSVPYQFCVSFSTLFWCLLGLWFTGRLLRRFYSEPVTALTLLLLAFGTNIYAYTCTSTGMSHLLVLLQFALLLWCCARWQDTERPGLLYAQGALLGWILITRPVDALILLVPLLWTLVRASGTIAALLKRQAGHLLIAAVLCGAVAAVQLLYWKWTTGQFLYFSYVGEGFRFGDPQIVKGLFSYYRGWFVYTPLALAAFTGFLVLPPPLRAARPALLAYLCAIVYVVFSWYYWSYGWSFGCRALIESLVVLSLPLAALIRRLGRCSGRIKGLATITAVLVVALNIFQTHQYASNVLPDGITRAYYWRVFLKPAAEEDDRKLLRPQPFSYP